MIFKVSRTSDFWNEKPPCKEAVLLERNDIEETRWEVEINTLRELMAFIERNGSIVMNTHHIEIYDALRE